MTFYIRNTLKSTLLFRAGYVEAKPGVWTPVLESDVAAKLFEYEVQTGAVELQEFDTPPVQVNEFGPVIAPTDPNTDGSLTEEQLKAMLNKDVAPAEAPAEAAPEVPAEAAPEAPAKASKRKAKADAPDTAEVPVEPAAE